MTSNPFGCHRLQISASNNPWYNYYTLVGNHYRLNRDALIGRIELASDTFKYCPVFDIERIKTVTMSLPLILKKREYEDILIKENNADIR